MKGKIILKRSFIIAGLIASVIALVIIARSISYDDQSDQLTAAEEGRFEITVSATGDLYAEKSTELKGPAIPTGGMRRGRGRHGGIRARSIEIEDIVPEGTIVKQGDYVAQLDKTYYENTLKDEIERLNTLTADLEMKVHDTALTLTRLRDEIRNQTFAVEEAVITLKQSSYEPPATIRKAEIVLDEEQRSLKQKQKRYKLMFAQEVAEIENIRSDISSQQRLIEDLKTYLEGFTILSPAPGMVTYKRNWNGTKREAGSSLNPFDMVVATLPDLSSMISKIYISEIDISKIKTGQKVNILVDAFPDKNYTGTVTGIARIGEKLPNSDTKVFEVLCRLDRSDPDLRPSMTTSNEIIVRTFDNVVFVPVECVYADSDGLTYVFTNDNKKQIVLLGESNGKQIIVEEGLEPGTEVYLSMPDDIWKFKLTGDELITKADPEPEVTGNENILN